jgi:IstB-like ATP binding protein
MCRYRRPVPSCCSRCSASDMSAVQPSSPPAARRMDQRVQLERLTGALLDRLTHRVHILEMDGDSYRLNQSKRRSRRASSDTPEDNPTQARCQLKKARFAGCVETETRGLGDPGPLLSCSGEPGREIGCADQIDRSQDVVGEDAEGGIGLCSGEASDEEPPARSHPFDGSERVFGGASPLTQRAGSASTRASIRPRAWSWKWRVESRRAAVVQRGLSDAGTIALGRRYLPDQRRR